MRGRAAGWWGLGFCVLLLVSAGMATVPDRSDQLADVRHFYLAHSGVVVLAQVIGLVAAAAFVPFVLGLPPAIGGAAVARVGLAVPVAAVLTAVPVLALCALGGGGSASTVRGLVLAGDLADVLLFVAVAALASAVAAQGRLPWLRLLAAVVGALAVIRAVLLLLGSALLQVVAPVAFLVLVVALSGLALQRGTGLRSGARSGGPVG